MEGQNWNNTLEYVKLFLGVPVNLLEISDDDLITYLKDQVLPLFSQYSPYKKWLVLTEGNQIFLGSGSPIYTYRMPLQPGEYVIDVLESYFTKDSEIVDIFGGSLVNAAYTQDLVIANTYIDAVRSLRPRNTWEFIPPDIMTYDLAINNMAIVVYNTTHEVLNTIRPDLYHKAFKPLCLGITKIWVAAMRSKFEGLATPFGPLNLNYDKLQTEGETLRNDTIQILEQIPPDILIDVS